MDDDLSASTIEMSLKGRFGRPLQVHSSTGSTNADALRLADDGAPEGAVVVADTQTEGRGRRDRSWLSQPGQCLTFSLLLRPLLPVARLSLLTTALGLAVAEAAEELSGVPLRVRWPNDVTARGRKLAGVLVETRSSQERATVAVCGVGLNCYWRSDEIPSEIARTATSLAAESEGSSRRKLPSRAEFLEAILSAIEKRYALVGAPRGVQELLDEATTRSDVLNREVWVRLADGRTFTGRARRLLASGALEVDTGSGRVALTDGEVELLRHQ